MHERQRIMRIIFAPVIVKTNDEDDAFLDCF